MVRLSVWERLVLNDSSFWFEGIRLVFIKELVWLPNVSDEKSYQIWMEDTNCHNRLLLRLKIKYLYDDNTVEIILDKFVE